MLLCSISSRKVRHQFKVLGRFSFYPPCQQNSLKCALHGLHTAATTSKYSHVPVLANEIVREIMPAYRGNVVLDYTLGAGQFSIPSCISQNKFIHIIFASLNKTKLMFFVLYFSLLCVVCPVSTKSVLHMYNRWPHTSISTCRCSTPCIIRW